MNKLCFVIILLTGLTNIIAQNVPNSGSCPGIPLFIDHRDGKIYNTVLIDSQCWMKENLNVGTLINSTENQTKNGVIEKYCIGNNESGCDTFGGLYQWDEVMEYSITPRSQGICPQGWLVPTDEEWCSLSTYLDKDVNCNGVGFTGDNAGGLLKETGTSHWLAPNAGATNESGFTGLPAGYCSGINHSFQNIGCYSYFHTSSTNGTGHLGRWVWLLSSDDERISRISFMPGGGYSLRCIRDENFTSQLSILPANQEVNSSAGTATFEVTSNTYWTVEESVDWLSVDPLSGVSNGILRVFYDANLVTENRIGQITVTANGGSPTVIITVAQNGSIPTLTITPTNQSVTSGAGTSTFEVNSNTAWTVEESVEWFTVTPENGSQNGTLIVSYNANTSTLSRTGEIIITTTGGNLVATITLTQEGGQQTWTCGQSITDIRDYQTYSTIQIGNQCWMAENLNIGTRINGSSSQSNNGTFEKYCFENTEANCDVFGGLYQWNEAMDYITLPGAQGICPVGWHIPTNNDWTAMTNYISSQTAYQCNSNGNYIAKALAATTNWSTDSGECVIGNNFAANNTTGFTALPGGVRGNSGSYNYVNNLGLWWSSSQDDTTYALGRLLYYSYAQAYSYNLRKSFGFSVRCLKN